VAEVGYTREGTRLAVDGATAPNASSPAAKARCGNNEGGRMKDEPDMRPDRILAEYRERIAKRGNDAK
jgi:hypothetical protein